MKKSRFALAVVLVLAASVTLSIAVGCGGTTTTGTKAKVIAIVPDTGQSGMKVTIVGQKFGTSQGAVKFGSKAANVSKWTDKEITATVPSGLAIATYGVTLLTDAGKSNYVQFSVTKGNAQPDRKEGDVEYVTAQQAMIDWMKKKGIDPTGWSFSIVQISEKDPNWKIDEATKPGQKTIYFLFHKEKGNWVIKDDGNAITKQQLTADGAPSDLYSQPQPAPAPTSQSQAVANYLKSKGIDPTGWTVGVTRVSSIDPSWELALAQKPGQQSQTVLLHKVNGNWTVALMGPSLTSQQLAAAGAPKDLIHTNTEGQAIGSWISGGHAPPGVPSSGWSLQVIKVSRIDSDWEIVQGTNPSIGGGKMYFVLHWENGQWVVKDDGGTLTRKDLNAPGMPNDLP